MKLDIYHKKGAKMEDLLNLREASQWASEHLGKKVPTKNWKQQISVVWMCGDWCLDS